MTQSESFLIFHISVQQIQQTSRYTSSHALNNNKSNRWYRVNYSRTRRCNAFTRSVKSTPIVGDYVPQSETPGVLDEGSSREGCVFFRMVAGSTPDVLVATGYDVSNRVPHGCASSERQSQWCVH